VLTEGKDVGDARPRFTGCPQRASGIRRPLVASVEQLPGFSCLPTEVARS